MNLPTELIFDILLQLPYEDVMQYCQVNHAAWKICQSEVFWNTKAEYDFGVTLNVLPNTPQDQYLRLSELQEMSPMDIYKARLFDYMRQAFTTEELEDLFVDIVYGSHQQRVNIDQIIADLQIGLPYLYDLVNIEKLIQIALDDPWLSFPEESYLVQYLESYLPDDLT